MGESMSALTHCMRTTTAMLRKDQPPFWVRTTWLFAELEELRLPEEAGAFAAMKAARLTGDFWKLSQLLADIDENTKQLPASRQRHERGQLVAWIKEQIEREASNAG